MLATGVLCLLPIGSWIAETLLGIPPFLHFHDYLVFWASGPVVREHGLATLYDPAAFSAEQNVLLAGVLNRQAVYRPWLYPPTFLVISTLLAWLPVMMGAWLIQLGGLAVLRTAFAERTIVWLAVIGSPAAFSTLAAGQLSAWITAAILGGILLMERRPVLAGALLGFVSVKPHVFVLLPLALLSARAWRALGACLASAATLGLISLARFGWAAWAHWLSTSTGPGHVLDRGFDAVGPLMGSAFASIRAVGGSVSGAWAVQGVAMLVAVGAVVVAFRSPSTPHRRLLVLSAATMLFAPYWLPYDLLLPTATIALAFVSPEPKPRLIGEQAVWLAMWLLPTAMLVTQVWLGIPITIPVVGAMLWFALDRPWFWRPDRHARGKAA